MLRALLWIPGVVLIVAALLDVLASSLQSGEGRLAWMIHRPLYAAVRWLAGVTGRRTLLAWSGSLLVVGTFLFWALLTWVGWALVFWSGQGELVGSSTGTPADPWDVLYFVGYTLATLGLGDLKPLGNGWRLLTDVAALNGFFLFTFAISFIVPTAQAQADRRIVALRLHSWGGTAQGLILTAWHDHPEGLAGLIGDVRDDLNALDAQHKNTPALFRFHDRHPQESLELALPALDEALTLIEHALDLPPPRGLRILRSSISSVLDTYRRVYGGRAPVPPPFPDLAPLRAAGLPVRPDTEVHAALAALGDRRSLLRAMTERGGFDWQAVET
ncbi:Ion transport 2 [Deinococcus phoenicis]|uniref:Ion transport 2 n=1 Tax=Deinococcus phoenicis TaxID=1476583 RepID=A0A016QM61_9DEIO|nr:potassium channel family protein [Deinococcus phoenicis]EYB66879.1 Ion transport 2 [Deinococcus phoenicis]